MSSQLEDLKRYVTAKDGKGRFGPETLALTISHSNLKQQWIEIRFHQSETVGAVKQRLYKHGGTPPDSQRLQLFDTQHNYICELANDAFPLHAYQVRDEYEIRIVDTDPYSASKQGALEDVSLVEKYVMDDETYDAKENTVRKFMQQKRLERQQQQQQEEEGPLPENLKIGKRCEVNPGGRRGMIQFVGKCKELDADCVVTWVGVVLDEPMGKNDGTVKGRRLFTCAAKHGVLVRPSSVNVDGDFPERALEDSDEDEF